MLRLFIPEGVILMGRPDGDLNICLHERLQHDVWSDFTWIDQPEVTKALYARCVAVDPYTPPRTIASTTCPSYYGNPAYVGFLVVWVHEAQAQVHCEWAGWRSLTEAECEKAAS